MSFNTRMRRLTYLVHRWTGIAGCLLMLLWFVSGVVMLYVGYPKLTPWERLGALPALGGESCCLSPAAAVNRKMLEAGADIVLTSIRKEPHYVVRAAGDRPRAISALTGASAAVPVTADQAVAAARAFAGSASARHEGVIREDRWTHSRGLDRHRPLHRVRIDGGEPATLYVSSATGQVVMDAPLAKQRWNYAGAWLHWLYVFRDKPDDPVWSWTVIVLSAFGTVTAISGVIVGLWRWRFSGRYKSGSRSPYREPWMKWHHIVGLLFSAFVCTWIFSGLMSMNPVGMFSARHGGPDIPAYRGAATWPAGPIAEPASVLQRLADDGFDSVELSWRRLGGEPYVLAYDAGADSRIVYQRGGRLIVARQWAASQVAPYASRLFAAPTLAQQVTAEYDAYYYQRHPEAMNGAFQRGLPALRLDFADPDNTRVYIDLRTGEVATILSRPERLGRWLFYFLHSWDTPGLLRQGAWRDLVLILLSLGGIVISASGVVIGWRRLRH